MGREKKGMKRARGEASGGEGQKKKEKEWKGRKRERGEKGVRRGGERIGGEGGEGKKGKLDTKEDNTVHLTGAMRSQGGICLASFPTLVGSNYIK